MQGSRVLIGQRRLLWMLQVIFCLLFLSGCVYLQRPDDVAESHAIPPKSDSRIARSLGSGRDLARAALIEDPTDALTSRIDLINAADSSIDTQYFIWQNDPTGILVIEKLLQAADRGVRVRVLIDDVPMQGLVSRLNVLDDHPNIEIRVFNPFSVRIIFPFELFRLTEFAIDGNRLNHRMHNKLMIADNQLAILGGRNIGDDYFGVSTERDFIDTDILLSGKLVRELSKGFDYYWNSGWAYPVHSLASLSMRNDSLDALRARISTRLEGYPTLTGLISDDSYQQTIQQVQRGFELFEAATVIDDPSVRWFDRPDEIAAQLTSVARNVQREVMVVSPYFVPTRNMFSIAKLLRERGVDIKVVTNSLATNDVVLAHAAYAGYRKSILAAGVDLYEMRADANIARGSIAENISLHSKYIIFDDEIVFIGSLNLDPRSLYINTELGVILRSPELAKALRKNFRTLIQPQNTWRVTSTAEGLRWTSSTGVVDKEPARSSWQRFKSTLMSIVPVSDQL